MTGNAQKYCCLKKYASIQPFCKYLCRVWCKSYSFGYCHTCCAIYSWRVQLDPRDVPNYTGQQTKNLCKQRKFWQRMQRKQRKILVINPLFCTIFQEKMSILWKNFGIWIFLIKLQHKTTIKLGEKLQNRSFYLIFFQLTTGNWNTW